MLRHLHHFALALTFSTLGLVSCANAGKAKLVVGDVAPDFGQTWRLSDFRGKQAVVIAWYPKAFTGG